MNVYAESSAVLCWLIDEPGAPDVRRLLGQAELVLASNLTLIECERVLIRAVATGLLQEAVAVERRGALARTSQHWVLFDLDNEVLARACRPFPAEPIRTVDAIHLATTVLVRSLVPDLAVLSLDGRCRRSAREMGFRVVPDVGPET